MANANDLVIKREQQQLSDAFNKGRMHERNAAMMISNTYGKGGSPGQLFGKPPVTNPGRGEAVYGTEKDGQRFFEFLKAMMIDPANNIRRTGKKPLANDDDYGEGEVGSGWKISHGEGRGPQQKFHDEYNRPLDKPPWRSIYPSGETLDIEWQKEKYMKDHPQFFPEQQANIKDSMQRENVGGTLRDMLLPLLIKEYGKDGSGGYKNPSKLLSGMKKLAKNLPANNIRRLQDTGHMTIPQNPDGTGPLRIIDLLGPQSPQA